MGENMKLYWWECAQPDCDVKARSPQKSRGKARFFGKLHGSRAHGNRKLEPKIIVKNSR